MFSPSIGGLVETWVTLVQGQNVGLSFVVRDRELNRHGGIRVGVTTTT